MEEQRDLKVNGAAEFESINISNQKVVTLKVKMRYDEIITSIHLLQGLNTDITVLAKIDDNKPKSLGIFQIAGISFDKDGNAKIPFKSMVDNVNLVDVMTLVDAQYIQLLFKAILTIEVDEEE